jgi:hypothetical protein
MSLGFFSSGPRTNRAQEFVPDSDLNEERYLLASLRMIQYIKAILYNGIVSGQRFNLTGRVKVNEKNPLIAFHLQCLRDSLVEPYFGA